MAEMMSSSPNLISILQDGAPGADPLQPVIVPWMHTISKTLKRLKHQARTGDIDRPVDDPEPE